MTDNELIAQLTRELKIAKDANNTWHAGYGDLQKQLDKINQGKLQAAHAKHEKTIYRLKRKINSLQEKLKQKNDMSRKKYSIAKHWDTAGLIKSTSCPTTEFGIWIHAAFADRDTWTGYEFTKQDFIDYINNLKDNEPTETYRPCGAVIL